MEEKKKESLDLINHEEINENKTENDNNNNNNENVDDDSDDDDIENLGKNTNKKNNTNSKNNIQNEDKGETNINNFNIETKKNINNSLNNISELINNVNAIKSLINTEEYDENIENLNSQQDYQIRNGTIISTCLCILSLILSIFIRRKDQFLTLQKDYKKNPIFINIYIVYLYIFILIICNCVLLYFLTCQNTDKNLRRILYKYLRWFFILTQGFFSCFLFTGLISEKGSWPFLLSTTLSMTIIILLAFYYEDIKIRKDLSIDTLISIFIYISLLFALIIFITLSNLCSIFTYSIDNDDEVKDYLSTIIISVYSFQTIISIVNLTYFKDFFFVVGSFLIELGILINRNKDESSEIITLIICILLLLLSSGFTIYRYKYEVIGISQEDKNNEITENII